MNVKPWIEAMRLRTLPVSVAGVTTAVGYAVRDEAFEPVAAGLCLAFALLAQIASNFANEYFDYKAGRDRPGREGPRRGVTEGDISPRAMCRAAVLTLAVACCLGLLLVARGGWWLVAVGAAVAVGVFAYSTGPYPLSTKGWGEIAVIVFFGLVPVSLCYYVQALQWDWSVAAGSLAIGLLGANVLIVNNYRDIEDDRAVGKRTLAVRFGRMAMCVLYAVNALVAMLLMGPCWDSLARLMWLIPTITAAAAGLIVREMSHHRGAALTPLLGATAMLMFAYSLLFLLAAALT